MDGCGLLPVLVSISSVVDGGFVVIVDGKPKTVLLGNIRGITVRTTGQGPFLPDCFWYIDAGGAPVIIDNEDQFILALLSLLQGLPGFDNEQLVSVMQSVENACFVVYKNES